MREILFRGKAYDNKWVEGCLITAPNYSYCCILEDEDKVHPMDYPYLNETLGTFDGCATPIDPTTVCQFTGDYDKYRKKIFEKDILKTTINGTEYIGSVRYLDGAFGVELGEEGGMFLCFFIGGDCEIIGNIFDNPELLER